VSTRVITVGPHVCRPLYSDNRAAALIPQTPPGRLSREHLGASCGWSPYEGFLTLTQIAPTTPPTPPQQVARHPL